MMKTLSARTALLTTVLLLVPGAAALAQSSAQQLPCTISASATTLSGMEEIMQSKMQKLGGSHYRITSARMGNRTTGTAIVYK